MIFKKIIKSHGQTLIETIVATGIVTLALVAILSLALSTLSMGGQSTEWVQAISLGREAIEKAYAIRASNWFNEAQKWPFGLTDGAKIVNYNDSSFTTASGSDISTCNNCKLCLDSTNKIYLHADDNGDCAPGLTLTEFRRLITVATGDDLGDVCPDTGDGCEKKVSTTIQWIERGRTHHIVLEIRLTDWR